MEEGGHIPIRALGILKYCLVERWKNPTNSKPALKEMKELMRGTWRLKGSMMVAALNKDILFFEFESPEETKRVIEEGRRCFWGGTLQLEWWFPEVQCVKERDLGNEMWTRVVGLPLHLWTLEIFKALGDAYGSFVQVDEVQC